MRPVEATPRGACRVRGRMRFRGKCRLCEHAGVAPRPRRLVSLDAARGAAVLAMLSANLVNVFLQSVPEALAHNRGDTLRMFDLPAPVFQFFVGVSLTLFLEQRMAGGLSEAAARLAALRRFVLLVLLGLALDGIGSVQAAPKWGVLQTLGLGGALATFVAPLSDATIGGVALAFLAVFHAGAPGEVHGGPLAALAFVPLTLAGLVVGRGCVGGRGTHVQRALFVVAVGSVLAAGTRAAGVPFNKVVGTSSFVALSAAVAGATLLLAQAMDRWMPHWLRVLGANALTAWVLLYVLVYYPAWLAFPDWRRLALPSGIMAVAAASAALTGLTVGLGRRGIRLPI